MGDKCNMSNIEYLGKLSREQVDDLYGRGCIGLLLYQPAANHIASQPNKMFEYMAAGLPIVASNFPLWKEIIEGSNCGICVDPKNVSAVRKACRDLLNDIKKAQIMGKNGYQAVIEKYNWNNEADKLIGLYNNIVK